MSKKKTELAKTIQIHIADQIEKAMSKEEIQEMYNQQLEMYKDYEKIEDEEFSVDKDQFFKDAEKLAWDIVIDSYITVDNVEVPIEDANEDELSGLYQMFIGDDEELLQSQGYLKTMVDNAKEKFELLGKEGEHFSKYFQGLEVKKLLKENGIDHFVMRKKYYNERFGE
tara:strand:+ start:1827 stop:2333 length:507 start_codon:yes stop_codon:yes gene_type:complete